MGQPIHKLSQHRVGQYIEGQALGLPFRRNENWPEEERFAWRRRSEWLSQDLPWPPPGASLTLNFDAPSALGAITVEVHYEIYDSLPLLSKWFVVRNRTSHSVMLNPWLSNNWRWWNRNPLWTDRRRNFSRKPIAGWMFSLIMLSAET